MFSTSKFTEEGLPGKFTINLPTDEDMVVDGEEDEATEMEEQYTAHDEVEDVENQQDLTLHERFHVGLDTDVPTGPPPGYVDDWWGEPDSDEETCGRTVDLDTCY